MNQAPQPADAFRSAGRAAASLRERVCHCLDQAEAVRSGCLRVSSGGLAIELHYKERAVAAAYAAAFLPLRKTRAAVELTLLTATDVDLSQLVPAPPEQGRVYADDEVLLVWAAGPLPVLSIYDYRGQRGLIWLAGGRAPAWELSRPACPLLNAAVRDSPWTVCHAAAVGRRGRMLLLAGPGGAGKTTAAVACFQAGWDYAGDDFVLVQRDTGIVEPLYSSARLRDDIAGAFGSLIARKRATSCEFGETKHELNLLKAAAAERLRGGCIAAVLLPRRSGATSVSFTPATRGDLFHSLFMVTNQGAPAPLRQHAQKLVGLAPGRPIVAVDTATDPAAIPAAFSQFLDGLDAPASQAQTVR